jgi:hypothetical protein
MHGRQGWAEGSCNATGACYHALGFHRSAARDYSQAFTIEQKDSSNEVKMQQFLAFYQVCCPVSRVLKHSCSCVTGRAKQLALYAVCRNRICHTASTTPLLCRGSWRCTHTTIWTAHSRRTSWIRTSILCSRVRTSGSGRPQLLVCDCVSPR